MNEWISVVDELPKINITVNIWVTSKNWFGSLLNGKAFYEYHRTELGWRKTEDLQYYNMLYKDYEVTHWMPLPTPPKL